MKIDNIKKLKNDKYKVTINGEEITTYDNVILENNLLFKKTIDDNTYKIIIERTKYYDSYHQSLKYALKKVRSIKEMKDYLKTLSISDNDRSKILEKLINMKIIDDLMFTKAYINDKLLLSKDGINNIKKGLKENNISENIIEEELQHVDNDILYEKLEKLIIKKINANHKYSNIELKKRIINDMLNLGYNKDDIVTIIDNNVKNDYEILKKEYNKIYIKYSKKLRDNELIYKIRQSLYLKGFNYDDIKKEDLN